MITATKGAICRLPFLLTLLISGVFVLSCSDTNNPSAGKFYSNGPSNPGGTGRYYMSREIGSVLGHEFADKLDRPEREAEQRTDLLLDLLLIAVADGSDAVVADVGAGSGYFTLRLASLAPDATVLAVDIQPEMLAKIEQSAKSEGLTNIRLITASEKNSGLKPNSADLILLVDVYHELSWPREYMLDLKQALKPGGMIVIVATRAEDPTIQLVATHQMLASQIVDEMNAVNLMLAKSSQDLPQQHFLVFRPADDDSE
jgi:ubiquinone/menaquinone biosynthesis C-methylase UbiE